jgi:hypothetical protein
VGVRRGAAVPGEGGYVAQLHEALLQRYDCLPARAERPRGHCRQLQLVSLARGGATTPTLIENQLPGAIALLESRNADKNPRNDVEVVTLHIGGNDVTNPIIGACLGGPTMACLETIQSEFATYRGDLETALASLRGAAGEDTSSTASLPAPVGLPVRAPWRRAITIRAPLGGPVRDHGRLGAGSALAGVPPTLGGGALHLCRPPCAAETPTAAANAAGRGGRGRRHLPPPSRR